MKFQLIVIYLLAVILLSSALPPIYTKTGSAFISYSTIILTVLLIVCRFKVVYKNHTLPLLLLISTLFFSSFLLYPQKIGFLFGTIAPFVLFASIKDSDYSYFKPLMFLLISILFIDVLMSYYERITFSHIITYSHKENELMEEINSQVNDQKMFRSIALFGHPLSNSNIIAFSAFAMCFVLPISRFYKLLLLTLSVFSILYCFASRGAAIVCAVLFVLGLLTEIGKMKLKHILLGGVIIYVVGQYLYLNIEELFPRFVDRGLEDDSSFVRIMTLQFYFSKSFGDLLGGGFENPYGEIGIINILGWYGLIFGSVIVIIEFYFWWRMTDGLKLFQKIIVFLSFVVIANMNNNMSYNEIPAMYSLSMIFIKQYWLIRYKKKENKLNKIHLCFTR